MSCLYALDFGIITSEFKPAGRRAMLVFILTSIISSSSVDFKLDLIGAPKLAESATGAKSSNCSPTRNPGETDYDLCLRMTKDCRACKGENIAWKCENCYSTNGCVYKPNSPGQSGGGCDLISGGEHCPRSFEQYSTAEERCKHIKKATQAEVVTE